MSHWFDRLAAWSAEDREDGEERLLTRRQAVRAAATGAGAIGLLGSPLVGEAWGDQAACRCWDKAGRINDKANNSLIDNLGPAALLSPGIQLFLFTAFVGTSAAYLGQVVHCGLCSDDPPLKPPPPKFQPCTQRGGVRPRGDQCGGGGPAPPPPSGCPSSTHACQDGALCCFGTDVCCTGCCCISEVGCSCCG